MRYTIGDTVVLNVDKSYANGDKIKAGTKGTVLKVHEFGETYSINFVGAKVAHRVLERDLR